MKTEKLDDAINSITYILDTLMAHRDIVKTGNCNTCWVRDTCKYAPKFGQLVRYNCPHYEEECEEVWEDEDELQE